ncbi:MAG: protein kinase domain-containing protein [Ignavibacteria bacterium]
MMIGQIISHYKILEHIGSGGMGDVYKAEDIKLKRMAALKFLPSDITKNQEAKERFIREARAASALDHPNICTIYEINETPDSQIFIAMAYYEGETLNYKIEKGFINVDEIMQIAVQIAEGLKRAHDAGIIHMDIKPGNIIVTRRGEVKILDFGLAKISGEQVDLTSKGEVAGTVKYMSPEQIHGEIVDHRTDIWSLGAVLYEMTTGVTPFKGEYEQAIIYSILNENPASLKNLHIEIPVGLEDLICKSLSKEPSKRYENMNELLNDLKIILRKLSPGFKDVNSVRNPGGEKDYRRLSAIMFTDMVGYSSLTQKNEALALDLLKEHREILRSLFPKFDGIEIETAGDSFFVEFTSALEAANCAVEIQKTLHERNLNVSEEKRILLRIGLHVGDVVHTGSYVHGDGVNLAARLEPIALPGSICVSEDAARQIRNKIDYPLIDLGKKRLKNFQLPINVYKIILPWESGFKEPRLTKKINFSFSENRYLSIGILLLLMVIGYFIWQSAKNGLAIKSNKRIAVLPFINISQESENEYFADGITEEIISNLAKISGLDVIARTSIMKYKNTRLDVSQIGNELNVGTILEGSVRKAADKARITVQLIDAATQKHIWSEDYNRELKDIFAVQSDIAMKVADELKIKLVANEKEMIAKKKTENPEAYRLYLLGRFYFYRRTGESLSRGVEYFKQAIKTDSNYALAYAGLADCYTLFGAGYGSMRPSELIPLAKEASMKAIELDDMLAEAHTSLAYQKFRLEWDWMGAEKEFKKAIQLSPGYAIAREWYALYLAVVGKPKEALVQMLKANELDPLSLSVGTGVARIYGYLGDYKKAINQLKKTIKMDSTYAESRFGLALTYWEADRYDEAKKEIEKAVLLSKGRLVIRSFQAFMLAYTGDKGYALKLLEELKNSPVQEGLSYYYSMIYYALGDADKMFEYLNKAYDERHGILVFLKSDRRFFKEYGSDPRYKALLAKMDFES